MVQSVSTPLIGSARPRFAGGQVIENRDDDEADGPREECEVEPNPKDGRCCCDAEGN